MAACCAVVYPHMNALGGGGFWIVKPAGCAPVGIDACGAAARGGAWPVKPLATDWKERLRRKPDAWPRSGGAVVRRRSTGAERTAAFAVAWLRAWEERPGQPVPVPGQGRSGLPAAVEPESEHGPRSRVAQGTHGRALPQGTRGSGGPGHGDAALQRRRLRPGVARRRIQRHRRPPLRPQDARSGSSRPPCATTRTGARASVGHSDKAQEIARACPDTRVVTVCDREGDGAVVAGGRRLRGARPPATVRAVQRRRRKGALGRRNGRC